MSLSDNFISFLSDIEPSKTTVDEIVCAHTNLRDYLETAEGFGDHCESTFLSGSYAKHTAIRPVKDEDSRDVDVDVESDYTIFDDATEVLEGLRDSLALNDNYSSAEVQRHSVGIQKANLDIDVVPLAQLGDSWYIGDSENGTWKETNPKGHKQWSSDFNQEHFRKYKPVVKMMKWWRREHCPENARWPKGITLEKLIADNFPSSDGSYDELLINLFDSIITSYATDITMGFVPFIEDPSLAENDLTEGYVFEDFKDFYDKVREHSDLLGKEGSSNDAWRIIFGDRFPKESSGNVSELSSSVFTPIDKALVVSHRQPRNWHFSVQKPRLIIVADVTFPDGKKKTISSNDTAIPKGCKITYRVLRAPSLANKTVKWQIVNTGEDASANNCLRGEIADSNRANGARFEETAYVGRHYVQCFLLNHGSVIAFSREFFINVL